MSIDTILHPTDFSDTADHALGVAVDLATRHGATLHLFHGLLLHANSAIEPPLDACVAAAVAQAEALLLAVGLGERLTHRPGELSGGEQQRVALARALVLKPQVLLADEPTGNLDHRTGEAIHRLLLEWNRDSGITLVVVTHNPALASSMDRTVTLVDGRIENEERNPH